MLMMAWTGQGGHALASDVMDEVKAKSLWAEPNPSVISMELQQKLATGCYRNLLRTGLKREGGSCFPVWFTLVFNLKSCRKG